MPRQTDCTPEIIKIISENIAIGLSNKDAATIAGITERAFYKWVKRGEKEVARLLEPGTRPRNSEAPFVQFVRSIKRAIPQRKQALVARIQQAARGGDRYTETYRVFKGDQLVEERITEKTRAPEWQAAAWLLERLHYDEFGKRSRVDLYDWRKEVKDLLDSGAISLEDIPEAFGDELAREFFESAGLDYIGLGTAEVESEAEGSAE